MILAIYILYVAVDKASNYISVLRQALSWFYDVLAEVLTVQKVFVK